MRTINITAKKFWKWFLKNSKKDGNITNSFDNLIYFNFWKNFHFSFIAEICSNPTDSQHTRFFSLTPYETKYLISFINLSKLRVIEDVSNYCPFCNNPLAIFRSLWISPYKSLKIQNKIYKTRNLGIKQSHSYHHYLYCYLFVLSFSS